MQSATRAHRDNPIGANDEGAGRTVDACRSLMESFSSPRDRGIPAGARSERATDRPPFRAKVAKQIAVSRMCASACSCANEAGMALLLVNEVDMAPFEDIEWMRRARDRFAES